MFVSSHLSSSIKYAFDFLVIYLHVLKEWPCVLEIMMVIKIVNCLCDVS